MSPSASARRPATGTRTREQLLPQSGVEGFEEGVIGRLPRPCEIELDALEVGPLIQHPASKLGAVVAAQGDRRPARDEEPGQAGQHVIATQPPRHVEAAALARAFVDDGDERTDVLLRQVARWSCAQLCPTVLADLPFSDRRPEHDCRICVHDAARSEQSWPKSLRVMVRRAQPLPSGRSSRRVAVAQRKSWCAGSWPGSRDCRGVACSSRRPHNASHRIDGDRNPIVQQSPGHSMEMHRATEQGSADATV